MGTNLPERYLENLGISWKVTINKTHGTLIEQN